MDRGALAMTTLHAALLVLVPGAVAIALAVDVAALGGWLVARWRRRYRQSKQESKQ